MKRVDRRSAGCGRTAVTFGVIAFTVFADVACNTAPTPSPDLEGGRLKESVETQRAINRYFHDAVLPRLKPCWDRLQGSGSVQMKYVYARSDTQWTMKTVEVSESRLPQDQTALATSCMQEASAGTSLPVDSLPVDQKLAVNKDSYVLNWTWPVPLPPDAEEQYGQMMKGVGGGGSNNAGCDGFGATPKCVACTGSGGSGTGTTCTSVCVGGDPPCVITENPNPGGFARTCTYGSGCSSGGLFGLVGGRVRF